LKQLIFPFQMEAICQHEKHTKAAKTTWNGWIGPRIVDADLPQVQTIPWAVEAIWQDASWAMPTLYECSIREGIRLMSVLTVPAYESSKPWPTLGPQVCEFIESYLVFGPGDLRGQPAMIDTEKRGLIYRLYEVFPCGHPQAGRRRFKRAGISLRKGSAKTEFAAWLAAVELHPLGPVRCDGWDAKGEPVGVGVSDPYIPLVAYTEEQSDELAYAALRVILEYSSLADDFDIGLGRIMRIGGDGKAVSLAGSPDARDGARTTFQVFDESHRMNTPRLKSAHRTMLANIPKRFKADAWSLEVTTAPAPGEGSIAEDTMDYARQVADGAIQDSRLFFFHRQASDKHDLSTAAGIRAAVIEASGPAAAWSDIDGIVEQWRDPTSDKTFLERVWLNRLVRSSERAFDIEQWRTLEKENYKPAPGALITLGFDGARWRDSTALVGCEVETGYMWLVGLWEKPEHLQEWEVPVSDVMAAVAEAFGQWEVWRMYADPPYWETQVAEWAGQYGDQRVLEWWTNREKAMSYAIRQFNNALMAGELSHDGGEGLRRHLGNAVRKNLRMLDDAGVPLWTIYKERADSPHKIDAAMAAILAWEARQDARTAGATGGRSVYEERGIVTL
jgi:phage terminase large subunit-like protein